MAPALHTSDSTTHQAAEPHPNEVELPYHNDVPGHPASVDHDGISDASVASVDPSVVMRKLMKGKDKEWDAVAPSKSGKKLTLLELPITHTNDLTSLALTNSNLHNLAIPHIYSRFDIVWPDATQMTTSDSKSVDALTYGLSTICLGSSFAHRTRKMLYPGYTPSYGTNVRRQKNDYAKYTKKFSLGNGPQDWVAEYMISKESGKMLGTLVALAVEKMVNLESFVWDMPTGVLSEIFMALASIPEQSSDGESKLEKVWVRWHDNSDGSSPSPSSSPPPPIPSTLPAGSNLTTVGILIPSDAAHPAPRGAIPYAETQIEFPTFSVLPPLKSLTVLDIDELAYLDEMAMAIERSRDRLQELRVGISSRAVFKDFVQAWDGPDLQQIDRDARWPGESSIGERRLGGVLGVLVGRIYDIRRKTSSKSKEKAPMVSTQAILETTETSNSVGQPNTNEPDAMEVDGPIESLSIDAAAHPTETAHVTGANSQAHHEEKSQPAKDQATSDGDIVDTPLGVTRKRLDGKLKLRSLELERVPLSIQVFSQAFDWTVLTTLTILECSQHDSLWKALRKQFAPTPVVRLGSHQHQVSSKQVLEYHLSLKSIHTDVTSAALISFLRDTLAPNSLEVLFLQDRRRASGPPAVTIDQIFKGIIRKHRASLQKVLLDSSDRKRSNNNPSTDTARWRNWVLPTDMLLYMTSGRMVGLRELAISLHFKDWHTFLQRLPNTPQLRSLNLQHIADHILGNFDPRELALQMVDIITLRPDIQLCYVGISTKCFEILESKPAEEGGASTTSVTADQGVVGHESGVDGEDDDEDDEVATDDDDDDTASQVDEDTSEEETDDTPGNAVHADDSQSEASAAQDSDDDESMRDADYGNSRPRLRLREILFYDDKVAIFKARHGKL
ncbi:F-box domain-containing protein [Colletotrichum orchidophilum]|uniref:F-box domain-containing protein n=1 Tax=Colletotrichum orchidophilum TaxID=1209926 RepID=A0A1G4APE9_9PEZI|nr:F-box domain-containing protein [Colletotrichum orchidophilum]OHE91027.1 F-box domain-containing protein [Colletotrichum orchidophilum]